MNLSFHSHPSPIAAILMSIIGLFMSAAPTEARTRFIPDETKLHGGIFLQTPPGGAGTSVPTTPRTLNSDEDEPDKDRALHTCMLEVVYDSDLYTFATAYATGESEVFYADGGEDDGSDLRIMAPDGTYDFCFVWKTVEDDIYNVVVKEDVVFTSDISLKAEATEATEEIGFSIVKSDGCELIPYTMEYDADYNLRMVKKGNTDTPLLNMMTSLFNSNTRYPVLTASYFGNGNIIANEYYEGFSVKSYRRLRVNPLSDKYSVNHQEFFFDRGYVNAVCLEWHTGDEPCMSNDPGDFIFNEMAFANTPLHDESSASSDEGMYTEYVFNFMSDVMGGGLYMETADAAVCSEAVCLVNVECPDNYFLSVWHTDYAVEEADWINTYDVRSCSVGFDNEGFTYNSIANGPYNLTADGKEANLFANPFAFSYTESPVIFGDNTPFMKFTAFNGNFISLASNGQKGESRKSDMLRTSVTLKNGSEVVCTYETSPRMIILPEELPTSDSWTLETCNSNVNTGGINGCSSSRLTFRTSEGVIQPLTVIQAIQMRDTEGDVTVRFANAEEGRVCIAGGQFTLHENEDQTAMWYTCDETLPVVEIWTAPHGSDEWQPLEVTNDPAGFHMPGLGHYFEASLFRAGQNEGWYDLKVSMRNGDGDSDTQILSPGFHIGDPSAIDEISNDRFLVIGDGYVKVPAGARIFGIDGREYPSTGLPKGCYVVVCEYHTFKFIIP